MDARVFPLARVAPIFVCALLAFPATAQVFVLGGGAMAVAFVDQGPGSRGLWGASIGARYEHRWKGVQWAHDGFLAHARYRLAEDRGAATEDHAIAMVAGGTRWNMPGDFHRLHAITQAFGAYGIGAREPYGVGKAWAGLRAGLGLHDGRWGVEITYAQSVLDATPNGPAKTFPGMMCWGVVYRLTAEAEPRKP